MRYRVAPAVLTEHFDRLSTGESEFLASDAIVSRYAPFRSGLY